MEDRYSWTRIGLHWIAAAAMLAAFILGQIFEELPRGELRGSVMGWHALAGLVVAALILPRLIARLADRSPRPPMPAWESRLAALGHALLYLLMAALPATGLTIVLTGNRTLSVAGLFEVPALFPSEMLHEGLEELHEGLVGAFLGLLALHIAATLWHAVIRRDGVAGRMIPIARLQRSKD